MNHLSFLGLSFLTGQTVGLDEVSGFPIFIFVVEPLFQSKFQLHSLNKRELFCLVGNGNAWWPPLPRPLPTQGPKGSGRHSVGPFFGEPVFSNTIICALKARVSLLPSPGSLELDPKPSTWHLLLNSLTPSSC